MVTTLVQIAAKALPALAAQRGVRKVARTGLKMTGRAARVGAVAATGAGALLALRMARREEPFDFAGKVVLIMGGSRGLGLVMARQLAEEGARLALLARSDPDLREAEQDVAGRGGDVIAIVGDVRKREEVESAVQQVLMRYGRIDVLINNAGVIQGAPIDHMALEDFEDAMAVHMWGPLYAMRAVVPHMRRQGGGRIVNISSIGGKVAVPHLTPYTASKFALTGLSDGMRAELARDGIRVTTVCPGLMRTGSHFNAYFKGHHRAEFAWFTISAALPLLSTTAESAARQIIEACRKGQAELTITPQAKLLAAANYLMPEVVARAMQVANLLLPPSTGVEGDRLQTGWESQSVVAPSLVTRPADRATDQHNQLRGRPPVVEGEASQS
jgi:NAD(P)-dependent dehydrogenase (short-subunit alcohol dehydrogenase family)